jgi:hypothetical protein
MPDITAQTADGVTHSFPDGTPDEVVDRVIKQYTTSNSLTKQTQDAARAQGAAVGKAQPPKIDMKRSENMPVPLQGQPVLGEGLAPPVEGSIRAASAIPGMARGLYNAGKVLVKTGVGGATGAAVGAYGGGAIGSLIGQKEMGEKIGGALGGLYGGWKGGTAGPELTLEETQARNAANKVTQRAADVAAGAREPVDSMAVAVRHRLASWLPTKLAPETESTAATANAVAGAKLPSTLVVPEPNATLAADRPGAKWSIPRKELKLAAERGLPGAGDVLQNLGKTVIYTPKEGVGYPGPRVDVTAAGPGSSTLSPHEAPAIHATRSSAISQLREQRLSEEPTYSGTERRATGRPSAKTSSFAQSIDPDRENLMNNLRQQLRPGGPTLTDFERNNIKNTLEDMEAHPGERNTLGNSPADLKKPKVKMSREEAEAASAARHIK